MASDSILIYKNKPEKFNVSYPTPKSRKKTKLGWTSHSWPIIITCIGIVHIFVTNRLQFKGNGNIASQMFKCEKQT